MMTSKRTVDNPWQAIDLMTDETLGWYPNQNSAYLAHPSKAIVVHYRPGRKRK